MCDCNVCKRIRYWKEIGIPEDIREYILEVEADADYYRAIFNGTWPNAVEVLRAALKRAEEKEKERNNEPL